MSYRHGHARDQSTDQTTTVDLHTCLPHLVVIERAPVSSASTMSVAAPVTVDYATGASVSK